MPDLQKTAERIETVITEELDLPDRPGMVIALTLPTTGYREAHWVSNVERQEAINILRSTADKLEAQTN